MKHSHQFVFLFGMVLYGVALGVVPQAHASAWEAHCSNIWTRNLASGASGEDVRQLQMLLNADVETRVALSGMGSRGKESSSYGALTRAAVTKFQEKYREEILLPSGLEHGSGIVGERTRSKLVALCAASNSATSTSSQGSPHARVTSGQQPERTLALQGAGGLQFTVFEIHSGASDLVVRSITLQRTGPADDRVFDGVILSDESGDLGDGLFNANHELNILTDFVIPAGASKKFTISADMSDDLESFSGQMPSISVVSIDASERIDGLPVTGASHTVNTTIQIGSARALIGSFDPLGNRTKYVGDTGIRFSGIRITADSAEDLSLESISWDQSGTAGPSDIQSVQTVVQGASYPTRTEGRAYVSEFSPAIVIPKGQSVEIYVQGDITYTGSNRTVQFDLRSSDDVSLVGMTYGYGVGIAPEGNTATSGNSVFITSDGSTDGEEGSPFYAGSAVTISAGAAVSIQK